MRVSLGRVSEPPLVCPQCGTKTPVGQLSAHIRERCPGKPEPTRASRWVDRGFLERMDVDAATADRWVAAGKLRTRDGGLYLLRDVDLLVTLAAVGPMQATSQTTYKATSKATTKTLTTRRRRARNRRVANDSLRPEVAKRLRAFADEAGGVDSVARRIDVPAATLRRALAGGALRRGTRALIESEIAKAEK